MPLSRLISVLHMPKSAKCAWPSTSKMTLSNFRSLQKNQCEIENRSFLSLPVNNIPLVQKLQTDQDFRGVEPSSIFVEFLHLLDVVHQIATVQVLHNEENVVLKRTKIVKETNIAKFLLTAVWKQPKSLVKNGHCAPKISTRLSINVHSTSSPSKITSFFRHLTAKYELRPFHSASITYN